MNTTTPSPGSVVFHKATSSAVEGTREGSNAVDVGTPPVPAILPVRVVRGQVGSERAVAEVTPVEVALQRIEYRQRRVEVHVGNPRRHDTGPVLAPLDADPGPAPGFVHRQQAVGIRHGRPR